MKVQIKYRSGSFEADPIEIVGTPPVGRGATIEEALGNLVIQYQKQLGLEIDVDATATDAEQKRRLSAEQLR